MIHNYYNMLLSFLTLDGDISLSWKMTSTQHTTANAQQWRQRGVVVMALGVLMKLLCRAQLVLRWVTISGGQTTSVFHQATKDNSASYPQWDRK